MYKNQEEEVNFEVFRDSLYKTAYDGMKDLNNPKYAADLHQQFNNNSNEFMREFLNNDSINILDIQVTVDKDILYACVFYTGKRLKWKPNF